MPYTNDPEQIQNETIQFFPCGEIAPLLKHLNCQEQNSKNKRGYFKILIRVKIAVIWKTRDFFKAIIKGRKSFSRRYVAATEYA